MFLKGKEKDVFIVSFLGAKETFTYNKVEFVFLDSLFYSLTTISSRPLRVGK